MDSFADFCLKQILDKSFELAKKKGVIQRIEQQVSLLKDTFEIDDLEFESQDEFDLTCRALENLGFDLPDNDPGDYVISIMLVNYNLNYSPDVQSRGLGEDEDIPFFELPGK